MKFQIYDDITYTFETPLPKLQYLDMSAVFMNVKGMHSKLNINIHYA